MQIYDSQISRTNCISDIVRYAFAIERNEVCFSCFICLFIRNNLSVVICYVTSQNALFLNVFTLRWKCASVDLISWISVDFSDETLNKSKDFSQICWPLSFDGDVSSLPLCYLWFYWYWSFPLLSQNHLWCICGHWCFAHTSVSSAWHHVDEPCLILKFTVF